MTFYRTHSFVSSRKGVWLTVNWTRFELNGMEWNLWFPNLEMGRLVPRRQKHHIREQRKATSVFAAASAPLRAGKLGLKHLIPPPMGVQKHLMLLSVHSWGVGGAFLSHDLCLWCPWTSHSNLDPEHSCSSSWPAFDQLRGPHCAIQPLKNSLIF